MVISIQELRKYERQRQLEQMQTAHKPGKFPWQKGALGQPVLEVEPHVAR